MRDPDITIELEASPGEERPASGPPYVIIDADIWREIMPDCEDFIKLAYEAVFANVPYESEQRDLVVVCADNAKIRELNHQFRGKDAPTNVLSFFNEDDPLGDIILGYETIAREADEQGKTLRDHTMHLVVHGMLHLLGHDHEEDKDAEVMEALEIKVLQTLYISNPYE